MLAYFGRYYLSFWPLTIIFVFNIFYFTLNIFLGRYHCRCFWTLDLWIQSNLQYTCRMYTGGEWKKFFWNSFYYIFIKVLVFFLFFDENIYLYMYLFQIYGLLFLSLSLFCHKHNVQGLRMLELSENGGELWVCVDGGEERERERERASGGEKKNREESF